MTTYNGEERRKEVRSQKLLRRVVIVWICLFTPSVLYLYHRNTELAREGKQAKFAFCVFKHDLEVRSKATQDFLRDHPGGIPGLPKAVFQNSVRNQQATIMSLQSLDCTNIPPE